MAYKDILKNAIRTYEDLEKWLTRQKARVDPRLKDVIAKYPMRVNTYYLSLIEKMDDGIWRQAIPDVEELEHYMDLSEDPLDEEGDIPLGGPRTIIHRYPGPGVIVCLKRVLDVLPILHPKTKSWRRP